MSEVQQQMARARQFVTRWTPPHIKWSQDQIRVVAMAILYGEQVGLESAAASAEDAFAQVTSELTQALEAARS